MLAYIITFTIVFIISCQIDKSKKNKDIMNYIMLFTIVMILSILGGLRDYSIGTDIKVYGRNWFIYACRFNDFQNYIQLRPDGELGYLLLNYIISRFTDNFNIFLFIHQLICNLFVVVALYKYRKKAPFYMSILVYLMLFYCRTYNYLRQSIALSILFFGFQYIEKKNIMKYLLTVFIAAQFHSTAYIGIVLYIIYYLSISNIKQKKTICISIVIATVIIATNIVNVMGFLHKFNLISDRIFYNYTTRYLNENFQISLIETFFKCLFIFLYFINIKNINKKHTMNYALGVFLIMDLILFQIRGVIMYADRLSLYFGYTSLLLIPQIVTSFNKTENRRIMKLILIILLLGFWFFKFVFENSGEVYPYMTYF